MDRYLTLDTAYWDPRVLAAADWINQQQAAAGRPERVLVIFFYLFDPFVQDVGGYCGGWSPQVVQAIEDAGYIAAPIVCMRPAVAGGMLTPAEVSNALAKYPALSARPVHIKIAEDQEDGSFTGAAWSQQLGTAMPTELYGSVGTVLSGYSAGISAIWIGSYPGIGVLPPPDLAHIPGVPDSAWTNDRAWQYVGSASVAGANVDVSISNIDLGVSSMSLETDLNAVIDGASISGISGGDHPLQHWLANQTELGRAIYGAVQNILPTLQSVQALQTHVATIEAEIAAAGGQPAGAPIMDAIASAKAELDVMATKVAKDLA